MDDNTKPPAGRRMTVGEFQAAVEADELADLNDEIGEVGDELTKLDQQIMRLFAQRKQLIERRDELEDDALALDGDDFFDVEEDA